MSYSVTNIKARVPYLVSGTISDGDKLALLNMAMDAVVSDCDLAGTKRKATLSPQLFNDIFSYTAPTDLKGHKIIDLQPRFGRDRFDDWTLVPLEEFDRKKQGNALTNDGEPIDITDYSFLGENLLAVDENNSIKRVLVSKPLSSYSITIDSLDAVSDWAVYGDGENLAADTTDFVDGAGALEFDISAAGGTTAGIYNASVSEFDITDYLSDGSFFVWVYITSATNLTNFILRVGSSASAYYSMTVTTTNEATAFSAGWNLLRFAMSGKSTTGTPDNDACDYVALYMTKAGAKISEVGYKFDNLTLKRGQYYDIYYYSEYGWQTNAGVWLKTATADTDILNGGADELKLLEMKFAEFGERHLRNWAQSQNNRAIYEQELARYKLSHFSEALPITNSYYDVSLP